MMAVSRNAEWSQLADRYFAACAGAAARQFWTGSDACDSRVVHPSNAPLAIPACAALRTDELGRGGGEALSRRGRRRGEFLGTSLWFTANAAAHDLARAWGLTTGDLGTLTGPCNSGSSADAGVRVSGLADRFPAHRIFALSAGAGALANAALALARAISRWRPRPAS